MAYTFNKIDYVMITVSNMARSVAFYKDKLGIPMKFGTPEWTEFQTGTTTLALHGGGKPQDAPKDPGTHYAGVCSIGFNVDNLDLAYEQLEAKGVKFVMPRPSAQEKASSWRLWLIPTAWRFRSGRPQRSDVAVDLTSQHSLWFFSSAGPGERRRVRRVRHGRPAGLPPVAASVHY